MNTVTETTTAPLRAHLKRILPDLHGHQGKALALFVGAILYSATGNQAALARSVGNKEAAARRLTRLLHNERICPRRLAHAVLVYVLSQLPRCGKVRLALDWTIENDQHLLVVSWVWQGRALPIFWRAYHARVLKGRMKTFELALTQHVLTTVCSVIGARRIIFTADRAFADEALAVLLDAWGLAYVIRARASTKVRVRGQWVQLQAVAFPTNTRQQALGHILYCESRPRQVWVSRSRQKNDQGTWETWHLLSNRPWPPKTITHEYKSRFGCEQGFRDAKHTLGFGEAQVAETAAWARFFALFALAALTLVQLGTTLGQRAPALLRARLRALVSRRTTRCELSLLNALRLMLCYDWALLAWFARVVCLNPAVTLPNLTAS